MSSSVFYKFKNSREPERIIFDGTGISVFELKREIITASGLGDGTDFDLHIYPEDQPTSEYDDDTTIISRSSTVIAVRRPAARGHGRAARYISGKAPVRAIKKTDARPAIPGVAGVSAETDAEAAFLAESAQVWNAQKEALSQAKVVYHKKKQNAVPDHEPPPGYVCYRCQKKGHWIQACPTNDDPDFKPAARAKRTTGIPRSFLKTVEKPADDEDAKGVMLNADGEYVQVMADTKTWEKFQEKTKATMAQAADANAADEEARARGLECPIDKRMFVEPVKTPCCGKTYCHDCIENALADGDLVCPSCSTEGVLIDDLAADEDIVQKIKDFEAEKAKEKLAKEEKAKAEAEAAAKPPSPEIEERNAVSSVDDSSKADDSKSAGPQSPAKGSADAVTTASKSPLAAVAKPASALTPSGGNGSDTDTSTTSKKRKDPPTAVKPPSAPKAMRQQTEVPASKENQGTPSPEDDFLKSMEALKHMQETSQAIPPGMGPGMPGNPMMQQPNMNMMGGMMNGMNPMMQAMNGMNGMNGGFPMNMPMHMNMNMNNGWGNGFNNGFGPNNMAYQQQGWNNNSNNGFAGNNMNYNQGWNGQQPQQGFQGGFNNNNNTNMNFQGGRGGPAGRGRGFPNQQGQAQQFNRQQPDSSTDAYDRKPLNPHRSMGRRGKQRTPDFHYV